MAGNAVAEESAEPVLMAAMATIEPAVRAPIAVEPAGAPAVVAPPCAVKDPEDGSCYPSADAADRAWLDRANAGPSLVAQLAEPVDEDADDMDDTEDGGTTLAPVDSLLPRGSASPLLSPVDLDNPAKRSFWKNLTRTVTGLVVRKSDSRPVSIPEDELAGLFEAKFPLPIEDFAMEKFRDSFNAPRGRHRRHHAIDLPAPRGTPVVAVVDGTIERLGRDRKGGKVCYLRDLSGRFTFYYAHLARHAAHLKPGDRVKKGEPLGEVGSTGHVIGGPHLHFAIFREDDEESCFNALAVNPYLIFSAVGLK